MAQSLPAAPSPSPGLPENYDLVEFQGWEGIDTKPPRAGLAHQHCAWCDNIMPLGPNNARSMPDVGPALYIATSPRTILNFGFFGLQPGGVNSGPYMIVFLDDGSAISHQVNAPNTEAVIGTAGTFPTTAETAFRQWGTIWLLITNGGTRNGYWIWDGSLLYGAGTIGPEVALSDTGVGYTSAPTLAAFGGSGSGAAFTATVLNGGVDLITPANAGTGWLATDAPEVLVTFTGGGSGTSAYGYATVVNGAIINAAVIDGGTSYTASSVINITDPTGTGATILITGLSASGAITQLTVTACGHGYTNPSIAATIGTGFSGVVSVEDGVINGFDAGTFAVGSGYGSAPAVIFIAATGSGASATAVLGAGGSISSLIIGSPPQTFTGKGYPTGTHKVVIGFVGGNGPASAIVRLMPFGVSGNTIEVFNSQVWIATTYKRVKTFFSAPNSVSDFGTPDGGGVFPATDSILRYKWTRLLESNGLLYLIGDSSVNYISGVQTTGTPPTTTFSNLNVDPQIGSPYADSCTVYSRAIIMVNSFGVHAIYGGAVQKISTPLDGIFDTVPPANWTVAIPQGPQSAVSTIYGVHVYVLLLPIIDPIAGRRNALLLWDGKRWWSATLQGGVSLTLLATLEWGSNITAYGSNGFTIWPLFQTPTTATTKTLQSRLAVEPSILQEKKPLQMYALWQTNSGGNPTTLNFTIDTENGTQLVTQAPFAGPGGTNPNWARSVVPDSLGVCVGFTMTSTSYDFTLLRHTILAQNPRRLKV